MQARIVLIAVAGSLGLAAALGLAEAGSVERTTPPIGYVYIGTPGEGDRYASGSDCAVAGHVFFRDAGPDVADLRVRIRIYRGTGASFTIVTEAPAELGRPPHPGVYPFSAKLRAPFPNESGTYLLRADCYNVHDGSRLLGTQSIFLNVTQRENVRSERTSQRAGT